MAEVEEALERHKQAVGVAETAEVAGMVEADVGSEIAAAAAAAAAVGREKLF